MLPSCESKRKDNSVRTSRLNLTRPISERDLPTGHQIGNSTNDNTLNKGPANSLLARAAFVPTMPSGPLGLAYLDRPRACPGKPTLGRTPLSLGQSSDCLCKSVDPH